MKKAMVIFLIFLLSGCAAEQNYRGVPSTSWKHLSAEQRQLIVDKAYQDDIRQDEVPKERK